DESGLETFQEWLLGLQEHRRHIGQRAYDDTDHRVPPVEFRISDFGFRIAERDVPLSIRSSKFENRNSLFIVLLLFCPAGEEHSSHHCHEQQQRRDLERQSRLPVKLFAYRLSVL